MGTIVEEIFSRKLGRTVKAGETVIADVDYAMSHDTTTPLAIKAWQDIGKPFFNKNKVVIVFDHYYPPPNVNAPVGFSFTSILRIMESSVLPLVVLTFMSSK